MKSLVLHLLGIAMVTQSTLTIPAAFAQQEGILSMSVTAMLPGYLPTNPTIQKFDIEPAPDLFPGDGTNPIILDVEHPSYTLLLPNDKEYCIKICLYCVTDYTGDGDCMLWTVPNEYCIGPSPCIEEQTQCDYYRVCGPYCIDFDLFGCEATYAKIYHWEMLYADDPCPWDSSKPIQY